MLEESRKGRRNSGIKLGLGGDSREEMRGQRLV